VIVLIVSGAPVPVPFREGCCIAAGITMGYRVTMTIAIVVRRLATVVAMAVIVSV
jgi:hypothetical protein